MYDYLLVIGPGRSGSKFLLENLRQSPNLAFPEIEGNYFYRSPANLYKTQKKLGNKAKKTLVDIANLSYKDPELKQGITTLQNNGSRTLLIVLLRDHCRRAVSMMHFRRSRGEISAMFGMHKLENAVVNDRLTPQHLQNVLQMDVDILTIFFPTLINRTEAVLDILSSRCGIAKIDEIKYEIINPAVGARSLLLSAFGKFVAVALRRLGSQKLLRYLKDHQLLQKFFFSSDKKDDIQLKSDNVKLLMATHEQCRSIIETSSKKLAEGVYFRKA